MPRAVFNPLLVLADLPEGGQSLSNVALWCRLGIKRCTDIVLASIALILLSPVMLLIALRIKMDGGSALFRQTRIGKGGRPFLCYKFRSMHMGAETTLAHYLAENPDAMAEWESFQKIKQDARITPFGNFLRTSSIDELPQLLNVLKGDMSIVGPRPITPGQEHYYGEHFIHYTSVRPGITGPWQVGGRNRLTFARRVLLESHYARHWSLRGDCLIILKTIPALFKKDHAF